MKCGWIPGSTEEASFLDPSSPWDDILWKLVHGQEEKSWWQLHFIRKAMEIRGGIATLASAVAGDAPVAGQGSSNVRGGNRVNRPPATKPLEMPKGQATPPPRPTPKPANTNPGEPRFATGRKHGYHEICQLYNRGQCNGAIRDGLCGPFTCPNADRIHACNRCGVPGHPVTECKINDPGSSKQSPNAAKRPGNDKGKGYKGGKRGKRAGKG